MTRRSAFRFLAAIACSPPANENGSTGAARGDSSWLALNVDSPPNDSLGVSIRRAGRCSRRPTTVYFDTRRRRYAARAAISTPDGRWGRSHYTGRTGRGVHPAEHASRQTADTERSGRLRCRGAHHLSAADGFAGQGARLSRGKGTRGCLRPTVREREEALKDYVFVIRVTMRKH